MNDFKCIRKAQNKDLDEIKKIWKYCFNDTEQYIKFYFEQIYKPENSIVCEFKNSVVASLNLNQHTLFLNENKENVSYVVGVSTLPQVRGLGIMKDMIKKSLEEMFKKNQNFSILMPIDVELYRKYGYEICYDILVQKIKIENLKEFMLNGNFEKATIDHLENLSDIYNDYISLKSLNGATIRDREYFSIMMTEANAEGLNLYLNDDRGYLLYSIEKNLFIVREIYYKDIKSLQSMLKFIYNHNTQCKEVIFYVDISFLINNILKKPQNLEVKIEPFMMGRIINLKEAIKNKRNIDLKNISKDEVLVISVIDDYISYNNGVFKIMKKERDILSIEKLQSENNLDVDLTLNINQLSQLMFSYKGLKDLAFIDDNIKIESISEKKIHFFNKIFKKEYNYINEYV